ncbi:glycosyltransferase family 4 protein [Xanthobacter autotrophicus DSM 431]|uniref:glycosyltransferase family 4 protein n=1 Tax=Xanthobacter nonsaccharivorans TaxID=3119912 RepID=UPI003727B864
MRIAYILSPYCYYTNVFSGVVVQARCWMEALQALGHEVCLVSAMSPIDWKSFDVVHLFQHGSWCDSLLDDLAALGVPTVLSPIIDPPRPYGRVAALVSRIPFERLRLQQNQRLLRKYGGSCTRILSRSTLERQSLEAVGVPPGKIVNAPISMSKDWALDEATITAAPRNGAVLHVSHLAQPRKNARLLIEVAMEKGFPLRLAGSLSDPAFASWLKQVEASHPNITYLGRISDARMLEEMLACSVFCLPSLYEGVGLVALDAGYCGANLVVSTAGGTRDYLGEHAFYIDPHDRAGLGDAIRRALDLPLPNLEVHRHVEREFSKLGSGRKLEACYADMLR